MIKDLFNVRHDCDYQMKTTYVCLKPVKILDGVPKRVSEFAEVSFVEMNKDFDSNDFSISSLIEVGAYNKFERAVVASSNTSLSYLDEFDKFVSDVSSK